MTGNTEPLATVARLGKRSPLGVEALYHALAGREWQSLAVICSEPGDRAWWLVQALEQVAAQSQKPVRTLNVLEATPARATAMAHALSAAMQRSSGAPQRYLVAADSPLLNPASLEVIAACEAVVLLVEEGRTPIPGARRLIELIGRERLMGAVLGSW